MKSKKILLLPLALVFVATLAATDENCSEAPPVSSSGLSKASATVNPGADGLSVEQRNVKDRLTADNKPGSIKHLYVMSAYSGQVLIYSTVRGKVTSSGKRLSPETITGIYNREVNGFAISMGNVTALTKEVLSDDGTYGSSVPYVYWFDAKGAYHQHYIEGGQILHISDQPLAIKSVVLNMESSASDK